MKRQLIVLLGIVCANFSIAQSEVDALRYSFLNYSGTSRFAGTGGSMSAIGADFGAIGINPAAQGKYKRGEFSFTTNVTSTAFGSSYKGATAIDHRLNFNVPNIGIVLAAPIVSGSQWRSIQFGYNHIRTNDFHSNETIQGTSDNSLLDAFAGQANGTDPSFLIEDQPFGAGLAYEAYAIEYDSSAGVYFPWYQTNEVEQTQVTSRRGAQYANDFTFSGNYGDKLLLGGSVGFPSIRYIEETSYTENFKGDSIYDLDSYTYNSNLNTRGNGVNVKIGAIVIPHPAVRLGFAVHSPTWYYNMTDKYSNTLDATYNNNLGNAGTEFTDSPEGTYEYSLVTPGRLIGSMGFLIGKRGFVSAEYEYVDYTSARLSAGDYNFDAENNATRNNYQATANIKAGAEFRLTNYWTIRGGIAQYGAPVKSDLTDVDQSRMNYSGGFGYRDRHFYLDLTYVQTKWSNEQFLYDPAVTEPAKRKYELHNVMVTAGFRF